MENKTTFSSDEYLRYTRHFQLPNVGVEGQEKLKRARVCVVGCGGLGAPVGLYLAAAGVGHLVLIDDDVVELSNLQRQISFSEEDIGQNKALQTQKRLESLNSSISVAVHQQRLTAENTNVLLVDADLVIDCCDNFSTRYAINDYCKASKTPWVYASIFQFSGQCALFKPEGSCYRCLFPNPSTQAVDCNTAGVIGVLPGILGTIQALEAIKYLSGLEEEQGEALLLIETLPFSVRKINLTRDKSCPCCGDEGGRKAIDSIVPDTCSVSGGANEDGNLSVIHISPEQFKTYVNEDSYLCIDVRNADEHKAFNIGGRNIPLDMLLSADIDEGKSLVFYCHSGMRSDQAAAWASENLPNKTILALKGGVVAYIKDDKQ